MTPRQRIEAESARRGPEAVAAGSATLLAGGSADAGLIRVLAGNSADWFFADPDEPSRADWLRVWGARGLLWSWDGRHAAALRAALCDPWWRVREMAAKVVARHRLDDLLDAVAPLREDGNARVRAAADRAVVRLTA